jgi:MFS superfamily sulfate permease-like transporter
LRDDLFAGVTLGAYAIPEGVAYATLAGLPPQVGICGYLLGGLGYALFGSARHLAIGPTSAISLMVGASVAPLAMGDPVRFAKIATLSAFVAAGMCIVAWLLRLSTLIDFISDTIMLGFKAGAKMFLELHTQLAKQGIILRLVEAHASVRDLLRLEGAEGRVGRIDRFETVADVIEHFQKEGAQI